MNTLVPNHVKVFRTLLCGATFLVFPGALSSLQAQTEPFAPTDWPATISPTATVNYGVFDSKPTFRTPSSWNQTGH